ncbi:VTT domain-containing protein [Vibrio europaeus]|uniref:DedA family protein n=1 Tax=Vibrio europaeus TaxID=300876 RepID=A0A178J747_9VIBR|nr:MULTISPECIES: VTT domain-containing protein [Vibrio oreintalis group]MDC5705649.1 VTT domain-containing protein [Vibrio europaeus]MDC5710928.1 VTT domain-containing protein [Vibrio europaeus]MDC5716018.1 VTT domain-containing protein [Vibrio europaeus]MDC5723933.1 VTT domain-containing protein [Vibrio europaeus]MDC5729370.1 VTT domain-containing protein [Vibrio europaeus]
MTELAATIEAWLFQDNVSVTMLFIGIVLLSYLLEDLAIVTAATLAVEQLMPTSVALMAIFVGISTGDLGLYLMGKAAQKVRFLRYRLFRYQRARSMQRKLHQQAFMTLFIVRFIPGLRTIGFTLSGFLDVPKIKFFIAVLTATGLWTALVFGSFFQLGNAQWLQDSQVSWLLIPLGLCLMLLLNKLITKTLLRDAYDTAR